MSQAIWNMGDRTDTKIKSAYKWISKAHSGLSSDATIKAFYSEVKVEYDRIIQKEKITAEETKEEIKSEPVVESKKQKLLSRVKIESELEPDEPKIEEVPTE
jgi:hypothetical protein